MASTTLTFRPPSVLLQALSDRQVGHAVVIKALPADLGDSPRAAANCLWHVEATPGTLRVRASTELRRDLFGELLAEEAVPELRKGQRWLLGLALECRFTPPSDVPEELRPILKSSGRCYRSRRVVVPEKRRMSWFVKRMADRGFDVDPASVVLSELRIADLGRRGGGIPYVDATCTGSVRDAVMFSDAVRDGVGKGKNFGLGLVRLSPTTEGSR